MRLQQHSLGHLFMFVSVTCFDKEHFNQTCKKHTTIVNLAMLVTDRAIKAELAVKALDQLLLPTIKYKDTTRN